MILCTLPVHDIERLRRRCRHRGQFSPQGAIAKDCPFRPVSRVALQDDRDSYLRGSSWKTECTYTVPGRISHCIYPLLAVLTAIVGLHSPVGAKPLATMIYRTVELGYLEFVRVFWLRCTARQTSQVCGAPRYDHPRTSGSRVGDSNGREPV